MNEQKPHIIARHETMLSPWSSVMARTLIMPGKTQAEEYHALRQADYVSVVSITEDGRIPLVRQYRPAVEKFTLELPGGLRDGEEDPVTAALREIEEETGLTALSTPHMLGPLVPDTGRLENRLWGFVLKVSTEPKPTWKAEAGVERLLVPKSQLRAWILDGTFDHALHIALIGLAVLHGKLDWEPT